MHNRKRASRAYVPGVGRGAFGYRCVGRVPASLVGLAQFCAPRASAIRRPPGLVRASTFAARTDGVNQLPCNQVCAGRSRTQPNTISVATLLQKRYSRQETLKRSQIGMLVPGQLIEAHVIRAESLYLNLEFMLPLFLHQRILAGKYGEIAGDDVFGNLRRRKQVRIEPVVLSSTLDIRKQPVPNKRRVRLPTVEAFHAKTESMFPGAQLICPYRGRRDIQYMQVPALFPQISRVGGHPFRLTVNQN